MKSLFGSAGLGGLAVGGVLRVLGPVLTLGGIVYGAFEFGKEILVGLPAEVAEMRSKQVQALLVNATPDKILEFDPFYDPNNEGLTSIIMKKVGWATPSKAEQDRETRKKQLLEKGQTTTLDPTEIDALSSVGLNEQERYLLKLNKENERKVLEAKKPKLPPAVQEELGKRDQQVAQGDAAEESDEKLRAEKAKNPAAFAAQSELRLKELDTKEAEKIQAQIGAESASATWAAFKAVLAWLAKGLSGGGWDYSSLTEGLSKFAQTNTASAAGSQQTALNVPAPAAANGNAASTVQPPATAPKDRGALKRDDSNTPNYGGVPMDAKRATVPPAPIGVSP